MVICKQCIFIHRKECKPEFKMETKMSRRCSGLATSVDEHYTHFCQQHSGIPLQKIKDAYKVIAPIGGIHYSSFKYIMYDHWRKLDWQNDKKKAL